MSAEPHRAVSFTAHETTADDAARGAHVREHVRRILLRLRERIRQAPGA